MKYFGKNILNHTLELKTGNISGSVSSTGSFGHTIINGTPIYGSAGNKIGIGEATTPGTIDGWSSSGNITMLTVKDSSQGARITIQGTDASLDLVDTGATSNQRWFSIYNQDDMVYMRGLNTAGSAVTHEFISFDLDTGYLGVNDDSPSYQLDVAGTGRFTGVLTLDSTISNIATTHVTASGNISGSVGSTGSFGHMESAGNVLPKVDNAVDLGSTARRWANLFVGDLVLSNEGSGGNDIDGTEGKWIIQEGEESLYLLNRKNNKKYKFKLEEVD